MARCWNFSAMRHAEAEITYRGIDISASMIAAARAALGRPRAAPKFVVGPQMRPHGRLLARQRHIQRPARLIPVGRLGALCRNDAIGSEGQQPDRLRRQFHAAAR